jgi:hypothetical protein
MKHLLCCIGVIVIFFDQSSSQQLSLKQIAVTNKANETPFVSIDGMTANGSSVFLVDRVMHRVAVLNSRDLSYRSEYSRSDIPEASLLMPGFIAVTSKHIFVTDFGKSTIRVFSPSFAFIKVIHTKYEIFAIAADTSGNIWIGAMEMSQRQSLKKIDLSGAVLAEIPLTYCTGNIMERYYTFCIDENDFFYVAYYTKNCIEIVHPTRGFIRQFMVPGLPATVPWSKLEHNIFSKDFSVPDGVIFQSITSDKHGRIYMLTGDYSETPFREIDICSTDGKFLSWCVLGEKGHLIKVDKNGRLISVEGKKNKVKVYEFKNTPYW